MATRIPTSIEGGCLCGGIRYKVVFANDHDWKKAPHTCECTQCRKNCGSLIYHFHTVTNTELTWVKKTSYAEYQSSPEARRMFCRECGSNLGWKDLNVDAEIELAVGTIDEEYLVGGRDYEDRQTGGFALALANPDGDHFHQRNHICGIGDENRDQGTQYWKESKQGPMREERR